MLLQRNSTRLACSPLSMLYDQGLAGPVVSSTFLSALVATVR